MCSLYRRMYPVIHISGVFIITFIYSEVTFGMVVSSRLGGSSPCLSSIYGMLHACSHSYSHHPHDMHLLCSFDLHFSGKTIPIKTSG